MATEYVDAGTAVPYAALSNSLGSAPPVAKGVTYERILNARDEPHNWLTYYGAYDGQRYSPLDQINAEQRREAHSAVGVPGRQRRPAPGRDDLRVGGLADHRGRGHVRLRLGRPAVGPRRDERAGAVALQARVPVRRVAVLRQRQPRGRRRRGEGLHDHPERARDRARRRDRQEDLGSCRSATCGPARAPRSLPWSSRTWSSSGARAASSGSAAIPTRSSSRRASACGAATWSPSPASPARTPGPPTARPGRAAARTAGSRPPTTRT